MIRCPGDFVFGPVLTHGSDCYSFDFTLVFEDCIFSIAPCAIALLSAAPRLWILFHRESVVQWPLLRALKLIAFVVLAALQLAVVALLGTNHGFLASTTLASMILNLAATLAMSLIADFEHVRSIHPSYVVQIFLFSTILCDLPRVRTQWFLPDNGTVAAVFSAAFATKVVVLLLESLQKFKHSSLSNKHTSPEAYQGVFGATLFWWLAPLFREGYSRDITMDDLWKVDNSLTGDWLYNRFMKGWKNADHKKKHCLTKATFLTFLPELTSSFIPRCALMGLNLAETYLVSAAIRYIQSTSLPDSYGYGLIGAYAICYISVALVTRWYTHIAFRTMAKIRGAMVVIIYKTMLTVRAETGNSSSALSLMSTDVDRITFTAFHLVEFFPSVVQMALALWILGTRIGASAIAPVVLCVVFGIIAAYIGKLVPPRQRRWMAAIQKRVGITSDIIGAMKGVKVAGLSSKAETQIQSLREEELEKSTAYRMVNFGSLVLGLVPMMLMPAVTFTVYAIVQKVSGSAQFDVNKAFTSLSLLNILFMPMMTVTTAWSNLASALACFDRIENFLLQEKREDYRKLVSPRPAAEDTTSLTTRDSMLALGDDGVSEKSTSVPDKPWIKIRQGSFGWNDGAPILRDVELDIMPGELTIVIGPVASGKSTLLKAILGEARLLSGSVEFTIPEEVAYCDQDAWLLNRSLQDNVLAYSAWQPDFYDQVIRACQLTEDIAQFPSGDKSVIGSQGVTLSGGQKQRVALARAVYNRKPIVILDDILKGLDADTYSKCFSATMGPEGLLRQSRTSVILATHNIQLLPYADHIVVLTEEGRILQRGSFTDLNSTDGYVAALGLKKTAMDEAAAQDARDTEQELKEKETAIERIVSAKELEKEKEAAAQALVHGPRRLPKDKDGPSRGRRNAGALFTYIRSMGGPHFVLFCGLAVCNVGSRSAQSLWLDAWTSNNARDPSSKVGYYVGIYILFGCLNVIFLSVQFWTFLIYLVPRSAKALHKQVLVAAMHAPLSYFVATDAGEIVNRFSQDMTLIDMPLPMSFMVCYEQVISAVAQIILTCVASGYLAICIPALLLCLYYVQKFYLRTSRQMRLLDIEAKSPLYSDFIASFSGLTALRAYGWTREAEVENTKCLDASQRPFYLMYCIQRWLSLVLNFIVAGLAVLLIAIAVKLRHTISPGLLGVALTSVMGLGQTLSMVIQMWTQLETSLGAVTRVIQFTTPREIDGPEKPPPHWPSQGSIQIRGLAAKYGDRVVLQDVSLDIQAGDKVAICGRSGSGKSTLISLLLRLYQPAAGTIEIDGIETGRLELNSLRENVVALPQDPMFLAGSVRYNLDPLEKTSDEELLAMLERTNLRAVIDEKGGLDADLDTDWLSAGQRQLFCLARAMVRKSRVLLLDEATSSLDRQTEAAVDDLIKRDFQDWTVIVVAHRLRTVAEFDKVVLLQEGRVVECDSPKRLLERDSLFKTLWDLQEN